MTERTNCNICGEPLAAHKDGLACCPICGGPTVRHDWGLGYGSAARCARYFDAKDRCQFMVPLKDGRRRAEVFTERIARELTEKNERLAARMRHQAERRIAAEREVAAIVTQCVELLINQPCEQHSGDNTPPLDELLSRTDGECLLCALATIEDVTCALAADPCEPPHGTELGCHAYAMARQSLNARERIAELEAALQQIQRVASGEDQVADDDSEGMGWIYRHARAAIAKQEGS